MGPNCALIAKNNMCWNADSRAYNVYERELKGGKRTVFDVWGDIYSLVVTPFAVPMNHIWELYHVSVQIRKNFPDMRVLSALFFGCAQKYDHRRFSAFFNGGPCVCDSCSFQNTPNIVWPMMMSCLFTHNSNIWNNLAGIFYAATAIRTCIS